MTVSLESTSRADKLSQTPTVGRTWDVRGAYLVMPQNEESRAVLAIVSEGHMADRDDNIISRCANVLPPASALAELNHSSPDS